jgi:hypothetical protein
MAAQGGNFQPGLGHITVVVVAGPVKMALLLVPAALAVVALGI